MSSYLSGFRVPEAAEMLYRRVLRSTTTDVATHARELGWSRAEATSALQPLIATRLVRLTSDDQVLVEDPRLALERLVDGEEARLEARRRALAETRGAIHHFTAEHRLGRGDVVSGVRRTAWEVVTADVAPSLVEHLTRSTTGPIRSSVLTVSSGPGVDPDARRATQAALTDGREHRALYSFAVLEHPDDREWMQAWAAIGEQQRMVESPPSEFAVFGADAVIAAGVWDVVDGDYVIIRDLMLVEAFTALFDLAWSTGLPVPDAASTSESDRRLLALLARGYKDEAIARYLGWGVRTVRRRVSALMDALGADTRFQLGVAAQQRGLLEVEPRRRAPGPGRAPARR
jgi:DNA-binding CsgD family transcriptional regulator